MGKLKLSVGMILFLSFFTYSQSFIKDNVHPYSSSLIGTSGGGITIGQTDYKNIKLGINGLLSAAYFFPAMDQNIIGIRLMGGLSNVKGKDIQKILYAPDGTKLRPDIFSTDVVNLSASLLYSYAFTQSFLPYVGVGLSYYFFNPKDENGQLLYNNRNNIYDKKTLGFDTEVGISIPVSKQISLELNSALHFLFTDYIDDIAAGKNKDFFSSVSLGISYAFISNRDSDGDGIIDRDDHCPEEPEDYDGFQDDDGCPDLDNDGDGIPDTKDLCPNEAEDYDGFQDNDGCPDLDNDGDGILDKNDKCPNEPEDFDGFQDDDGCPDLDNDNDGIPDKNDKCPDQPETINGYQDDDGCPDVAPKTDTSKVTEKGIIKTGDTFVLSADKIFFLNRAEIKPEAYKTLDEVVAQIKKYPDASWRIEGHMDSQGPDQWIRTMSSKRAEAVYYYFISHGLDASKFTIYGLGDKFPIANNTTEEGRAKNRRIAIVKEQR
jgi:outer membrane protein OmpA-like peptidoglycan-associated protein